MFPFKIEPKIDDEKFMLEALKQAYKAFLAKEVPVGAVLVYDGKVIARGYNQVELLKDATAHAEMLCLTSGEAYLDNWRLLNTTLYSTLEPCAMCAGAMYLTRIKRIVYGAKDLRHGSHGSLINLFDIKHPMHSIEIEGGVLAPFASQFMKEFFQKRREE